VLLKLINLHYYYLKGETEKVQQSKSVQPVAQVRRKIYAHMSAMSRHISMDGKDWNQEQSD